LGARKVIKGQKRDLLEAPLGHSGGAGAGQACAAEVLRGGGGGSREARLARLTQQKQIVELGEERSRGLVHHHDHRAAILPTTASQVDVLKKFKKGLKRKKLISP